MTQTMDFESDQKLKLLTDALRAGPGSPQWREAIAELRADGASRQEEYELLLRVREHLASGRAYREIRPGPGFTRKVIQGIEQQSNPRRRLLGPNANWIAAIAALVLIGVIAAVVYYVAPRGQPAPRTAGLDQIYFVNTVESANFDDSIGADWQSFGDLMLMADDGLRPVSSNGGIGSDYQGGGLYWDRPIPADQPFSLEATILASRPGADIAVQVFVTDDRDFDARSATTPHELVWTLKDSEANVILPGGHVEGESVRVSGGKQNLDVRIALNANDAVVEMNRRRMWSGRHHLDPARPRTIGVRFLARGADGRRGVSVQSVRVMEPEKNRPPLPKP